MTSPPNRHAALTYSPAQLESYLARIQYAKAVGASSSSSSLDPDRDPAGATHQLQPTLETLKTLQKHHLAAIPFENLSLHYSSHRTISLDPEDLFEKIVVQRRGGYCMENNLLFGIVLRSLGYCVYGAGGRVSHAISHRPGGGFEGWTHMINIVTLLDGKKYMVDVGFGTNAPTQPMPLERQTDGGSTTTPVYAGIPSQELRLAWDTIAPTADEDQRFWLLQWRNIDTNTNTNTEDVTWSTNYCFTELEFLPTDYEVMNFWTSRSPKSWFTQVVVAVKYLMTDDIALVGHLTLLGGELRRRIRGDTRTIQTFKTEAERLAALKEWFGIELEGHEANAIQNMVTELRG